MNARVALVLGFLALASGCRDRDPNTPIALTRAPEDPGGRAVQVNYILRDQETNGVSIAARFSVRSDEDDDFGNATAAPGSEGTTRLDATPGGTAHTFLWDAVTDLGPGRHEKIRFRIDPKNGGEDDTTGEFTVDNTDIFIRVPDLIAARTQPGGAETPSGGAIIGGGASLSRVTEELVVSDGGFSTRDEISTARDRPEGVSLIGLDSAIEETRPVLLGGDDGAGTARAEIDIYDAGQDVWSADALTTARTGHTVTRLAAGDRALVAGGSDGGAAVAADEVFAIDGTSTAVTGAALRTRHTATLLPDGRVLLAGGIDSAGAVTLTTLVYDPVASSYSDGPPLLNAREGHAAALLGGHVAVFGGRTASGAVLASGEIADAALTGAFDLTREEGGAAIEMTTPRADFTASAIGTTQVLLVGGVNGTQSLASAERFLFDSVEGVGAYRETRDPLHDARSGHEAVVFGTGRVLIVGGGSSTAEVYIPASRDDSETFDPEGSGNPESRAEHAAAMLRKDGVVVASGGTDGVVLAGGVVRTLATAEIYEPKARGPVRRLRPIGDMATARRRHTLTLLDDDRVLAAGGVDESGAALASAELFDPGSLKTKPTAPTWTAVADPLPVALGGHTATKVPGGIVVLAGGRTTGDVVSDAIVLFDPDGNGGAGDFTLAASALADARERHTATLLDDGRILFAGGLDAGGVALATAEIFDPETGAIAPAPPLSEARFDHAAVKLTTDEVLVAGGRGTAGGAPLASVDLYNREADAVESTATLDEGRADFVLLAASGGEAIIAGGVVGATPASGRDLASPVTAKAVVFDPAGNAGAGETRLAADRDLARPRRGMVVAPTLEGKFLLWGGRAETGAVVPGVEVAEP